jgi:hypothetical protein
VSDTVLSGVRTTPSGVVAAHVVEHPTCAKKKTGKRARPETAVKWTRRRLVRRPSTLEPWAPEPRGQPGDRHAQRSDSWERGCPHGAD